MKDILIVYCAVTYLFTFGMVCRGFSEGLTAQEKIGAIAHLMVSPLVTPIVLGAMMYK